jgi:hypothetical protein
VRKSEADSVDRDLLGCAADPTGNGFHDWPAYKRSKAAAIRAVDSLGVFDLIRHRRRHDLLVVAYHDVLPGPLDLSDPMLGMAVDTETLRAHMRELRDHHVPVSLSQVVGWLHDDASLPAGAVLVTFDDGHRNVRQHALPVLEEFEIPAVVFVTAAFLGERSRMTWYEELYAAVIHSPVGALRHPGRLIPLGDRLARARFCGRLIDRRELAPQSWVSAVGISATWIRSCPDVPDGQLAWL